MPQETYDPQICSFTFGPTGTGQSINAIEVQEMAAMYDEDAFTKTVSLDGRVVRTRNANTSGKFQLTLLNSSPTNDLLSAIANADRKSKLGTGPIQIADASGTARAGAGVAWITKVPDIKRAKELGADCVWVFDCDQSFEIIQGGTLAV